MEQTKSKKGAILEKYRGLDNKLLQRRETVMTVEEMRNAIRAFWPDRKEENDPNGTLAIRVWDSAALRHCGAEPEYLFILKPAK